MKTPVIHIIFFTLVAFAVALVLGCATIIEGTNTLTSFDSRPGEIDYTLYELFEGKRSMVDSGTTPSIGYTLKRADVLDPYSYEIVFEYPTEQSDTITLVIDSEFSYWVIGNVVTGYIGLLVDVFSGAWYRFSHPTTALENDPVYIDINERKGRRLDFIVVFETNVSQERLDALNATLLPIGEFSQKDSSGNLVSLKAK